ASGSVRRPRSSSSGGWPLRVDAVAGPLPPENATTEATAATATAADAPTTTYTRVRLLMVANGLLDGEGPVHLRLVRVAPEAVLALLQLHVGPRLGAQVGDGGVLVHARPLQVEVVEGGAVEDNEGVRPCLERVDGREGPCLERDREARAALRV